MTVPLVARKGRCDSGPDDVKAGGLPLQDGHPRSALVALNWRQRPNMAAAKDWKARLSWR